ncbi:type I phosphomannose isomerase catalytic subunit [Mycoplasma sp. 394]
MNKIIFLKPYFKQTLWANDNIKQMYHLDFNAGEAWLISTIKDCESVVAHTKQTLNEFIRSNPEFFGLTKKQAQSFIYPNLTKFLDAKHPLSIQVHPDDNYAKAFSSLGKNECWYVLKNNHQPFILGTNTNQKEKISKSINSSDIEQYLNKVSLQIGDFVFIQAGLVHGIPSETMVYELQQSSDITYRLYDYQRVDENGKMRQIHSDQSLETMKLELQPKIQKYQKNALYNAANFNLSVYDLNNEEIKIKNKAKHCLEIVVYSGIGFINDVAIRAGDVLLVSYALKDILIKGSMKIFINVL